MRSDAQKRLEQLRDRIQASARYQEGEEPAEDAGALLREVDTVLDELEDLIRRINRTNASTEIEPGTTLTDAIARRDVLRLRRGLYARTADTASGQQHASHGFGRQMRSELRYLSALDVPAVRRDADAAARDLRRLDNQIQQANWEVDLTEF